MKEIENREDVYVLVSTFYREIRKDEMLGDIFNAHIQEERWPSHLDKLTDFWMTTLFAVKCYKGSPTKSHLKVDKNMNYTTEQTHFGKWLQLWFSTIDALFVGAIALKAKNSARNMATGQYLTMFKNRPSSSLY